MREPVSIRTVGAVAFVALKHPPVNALSLAVRSALVDAFNSLRDEPSIRGIVLHGVGRCFSAGGDIHEFGTPAAIAAPGLSKHVHAAIEQCGKTTVAAIHGYALGGGLETAMTCHFRIAAGDARLGLPEANVGAIPLSGTQRLPRLIGVAPAIDMILSARQTRAIEAPIGLVDGTTESERLMDVAAEWALKPAPPLVRDLPYPSYNIEDFARTREAIAHGIYSALATHLLEAIEAGAGKSFDEGMCRARAIHDAVVNSPQGKAARSEFLLKRSSRKLQ
ncbi:MAG: enoyl-CoA hydratase-related protein [Terricaulis sp.]